MSARSTMSALIDILRGMAEAGTADYALGTANFWDDDHIQYVLDSHRAEVWRWPLVPIQTYEGGTVIYKEYRTEFKNFEQTSGGTQIFYVENAAGSIIGTALYTANYMNGEITFATDTGGSSYYITGRSYDLNGAAADIWRKKAAHYAGAIDIKFGDQSMSRSQLMRQCTEMANFFGARAVPSTVVIMRGDDFA